MTPPDLGREGIIVAKSDLLNGNGVILIHNWNRPIAEELLKSIASVQILPPAGQILKSQEDLSTCLQQHMTRIIVYRVCRNFDPTD